MSERCGVCTERRAGMCNAFFDAAVRTEWVKPVIDSLIDMSQNLKNQESAKSDIRPQEDLIGWLKMINCELSNDEIIEKFNEELQR